MRCALLILASLVPAGAAAGPDPNDRQLSDAERADLAWRAALDPPPTSLAGDCGFHGGGPGCGCVIPLSQGSFAQILGAAAGPVTVAEMPLSPAPPTAAERRFGGQRPQVQLDLGLAVIGADFEHPLSHHLAVQLGAQLFSTYFAPWFDAGDKVMGFGGETRLTWWKRDDGHGFYVAPFFRAARVTGELDGTSDSGFGYSAGAFAGWGFALSRKLDLRLGAGAQYLHYRTAPSAGRVEVATPFVALDAIVGYRL